MLSVVFLLGWLFDSVIRLVMLVRFMFRFCVLMGGMIWVVLVISVVWGLVKWLVIWLMIGYFVRWVVGVSGFSMFVEWVFSVVMKLLGVIVCSWVILGL